MPVTECLRKKWCSPVFITCQVACLTHISGHISSLNLHYICMCLYLYCGLLIYICRLVTLGGDYNAEKGSICFLSQKITLYLYWAWSEIERIVSLVRPLTALYNTGSEVVYNVIINFLKYYLHKLYSILLLKKILYLYANISILSKL